MRAETTAQSSTLWGQAYSYDGFGNLTGKTVTKGQGPTFSAAFDPATNRQIGESYDAAGNWTGAGQGYDVLGRATSVAVASPYWTAEWMYTHQNKRVLKRAGDGRVQGPIAGEHYFEMNYYAPWGQLLARKTFDYSVNYSDLRYFAGRLISEGGTAVVTDRLGSAGGPSKYFPYGEEKQVTAEGKMKFATYRRDAVGQDYADQRYYSSVTGRFWSPDAAPADPNNPQSWNRYGYVNGDPVNFNDLDGLGPCAVGQPIPCTIDVIGSASTIINIIVRPPVAPISRPVGDGGVITTDPTANSELRDQHPLNPDCPPLPSLPEGISKGQLQQNINTSQDFYDKAFKADPETAEMSLFGFLTGRFQPCGDWDYKKNYTPGTSDRAKAQTFGNFNFGAVLQSLDFSYHFSQSAAGVAQIAICVFGGACGTGIPFLSYPFGDQAADAAEIKQGYDYQAAKRANCKE